MKPSHALDRAFTDDEGRWARQTVTTPHPAFKEHAERQARLVESVSGERAGASTPLRMPAIARERVAMQRGMNIHFAVLSLSLAVSAGLIRPAQAAPPAVPGAPAGWVHEDIGGPGAA